MLFEFSFFLPLAFVPLFLFFDKPKEIYMLTILSFALIAFNWLVIVFNGLLNLGLVEGGGVFFDGLFRGYQSFNDIMLYGSTLGLVIFSYFIFGKAESSKKINSVKALLSFFLLTCVLFTNSFLVCLLAVETLFWMNAVFVYDEAVSEVNWKRFYLLNHFATSALLIFTLFMGLLEESVTGAITYNLDVANSFTISYVAGTLYSTQSAMFALSAIYFLFRTYTVKDLVLCLYSQHSGVAFSALLCFLSVSAGYIVYLAQHSSLFTMVYSDWGVWIATAALTMIVLLLLKLINLVYRKEVLTWKN